MGIEIDGNVGDSNIHTQIAYIWAQYLLPYPSLWHDGHKHVAHAVTHSYIGESLSGNGLMWPEVWWRFDIHLWYCIIDIVEIANRLPAIRVASLTLYSSKQTQNANQRFVPMSTLCTRIGIYRYQLTRPSPFKPAHSRLSIYYQFAHYNKFHFCNWNFWSERFFCVVNCIWKWFVPTESHLEMG